MKLVMTTADVAPRKSSEAMGHFGGTVWDLINKNTVGAEAMHVFVSSYPPGGYTRGHPIHTDWEQAYYIVSGTMTINMEGKEYVAPAGSYVFVPRGVEHNHRNNGQEDLVFVTMSCVVRAGEVPPLRRG